MINIWPLFIGAGRLGTIWIRNHHKKKIFMTVVTLGFLAYHFHIEREKHIKQKKLKGYNGH